MKILQLSQISSFIKSLVSLLPTPFHSKTPTRDISPPLSLVFCFCLTTVISQRFYPDPLLFIAVICENVWSSLVPYNLPEGRLHFWFISLDILYIPSELYYTNLILPLVTSETLPGTEQGLDKYWTHWMISWCQAKLKKMHL